MHTISLNTFTYLLIILPKSLTKASEKLWPAPHRCSPIVVITSYCFRSSIRESIRRMTVLVFTHHQMKSFNSLPFDLIINNNYYKTDFIKFKLYPPT